MFVNKAHFTSFLLGRGLRVRPPWGARICLSAVVRAGRTGAVVGGGAAHGRGANFSISIHRHSALWEPRVVCTHDCGTQTHGTVVTGRWMPRTSRGNSIPVMREKGRGGAGASPRGCGFRDEAAPAPAKTSTIFRCAVQCVNQVSVLTGSCQFKSLSACGRRCKVTRQGAAARRGGIPTG